MKTVYVYFSNHFDLIWRRGWERDTDYEGGRYPGYRRIEELCLLKNIALAERGAGAYMVEQALTMRAFLETHPDMLPRVQALYAQGLFEMCGAGEAIIDINQCTFETMARNMASGVRYCRDVLGAPPLQANHGDGFGSSAQFPQVIRGCGFQSINGLSYCYPDAPYWRGLDGSTIFVGGGAPGRGYFYDHCYHEPCRRCHGFAPAECPECDGTGLDLPQNYYPPFEPVEDDKFANGIASYNVCSEEMLPPEEFNGILRGWEAAQPDVSYRWGTPRAYAHLWTERAARADAPPVAELASRVENNPVQTGCFVSRTRNRQGARRCEAAFYGWETALALAGVIDRATWEQLFRELPLFFFHDAITGTHQDVAYAELRDRMAAHLAGIEAAGVRVLGVEGPADWMRADAPLWVFMPAARALPVRVPLPVADWHTATAWTAVAEDGRRFPVVLPVQADSPAMPLNRWRLAAATGPNARTRPDATTAYLEADGLAPLAWTPLRLEPAAPPQPLAGDVLHNAYLTVQLGEHGITAVTDTATGATIAADGLNIGELLVEEDEGDPWGTRKLSAFRKPLGEYTHLLGTRQGDGYQEAYYCGRYEPSLPFGREEDPSLFPLDWYVTVRLLEQGRRVDFDFEIYWKSTNRRVRAAFPTGAADDTGLYGIPGGWLRRPRYEQTETCLWSPNGDWPSMSWFGTSNPSPTPPPAGEGLAGWAVVNYGTPSSRIEDGRLLVSFLRSPGFGHCLERYAQNYPMPTSGIRDGGWHHFTLSLMPFSDPAAMSQAANALNSAPPAVRSARPLPIAAPVRLEGDGIELLAKAPFHGDGTVLRLLNLRDTPATAILHLGDRSATACDLLEEPQEALAVTDGQCTVELGPFQAKTVRVE